MKFDRWSVSTKLWTTVGGLLTMMFALSLWTHVTATRAARDALRAMQEYENRIGLAVQWKGMTEAVGERVLASSTSVDEEISRQFETRMKEGISHITKVQAEIVKLSQSDADKEILGRIAAIRAEMLAHNKRAREIKLSGNVVALRDFVRQDYMPAITRYLALLDAFVQLQRSQGETAGKLVQEERDQLNRWIWVLQCTALLLGLVLAFLLTRSITRPLQLAVDMTNAVAKGDLTVTSNESRRDEFGDLLRAVSGMAAKLRGLVGEVRESVDSITIASREISQGNQHLSTRTEQAASSLGETAATMAQFTGTVSQATDTARQANDLAVSAAQAAERGGTVVGDVVASMNRIGESARHINDIVGVIDSIAFQTNILALNAAVEAARAGEQGRGFAVVAGEVRALAHRSAEAAKEIKGLIETSVQAAQDGASQVGHAGQVMDDIMASVHKVSSLINDITASSAEQRDGIVQVNEAVNHLDQMTQQNAALVEEATATAAALNDEARRLSEMIVVFNVGEATHALH